MPCRNCGTELLPGKLFCHACGTPVARTCPNCHAEVAAGFRFCPDCGTEIDAAVASPADAPPDDGHTRLAESMPENMAEKIRALRGAIEGERKQVTVLFCDLAGSTAVADHLDPEVYHELLEQYLALAIHEVYRFEGIVNHLAGDGLMALFGAPIAHEDAPERAVRAALAIRDAMAHFNTNLQAERGIALPARIGIHTGPVVVGTVGNDLKMEYTAIGDTTNLASRLESLAQPGTVLISEATARLVRGVFDLREVGPLTVKGKSEPVPAAEVLGLNAETSPMAVAAARGLTPLVGRDAELAQIEACYARLRDGLAQVVSVVGDAGSGKSRLLYEFKQRLAGENVAILEARCSALSQMVPYAPFLAMLRQYFQLAPGEPDEDAHARIARLVHMEPDQIDAEYPLLCRLLSVGTHLGETMPPEDLKRETFRAVGNLVIGTSQYQPVVLILEDLHWIDEPSRELLEMCVGRLARAQVLSLVSHRPDFQASWRTSAALTQITLRPLLDDDVMRIARTVAGGELPVEIEQLLLGKAEGSPFFAEEITRSLLEEGYLKCSEDRRCRLTRPVEEIRIPGTVQEVLAARLDRLGAGAKRLAQVAAVLGRQFRRRQLEELLAAEEIDVGRELLQLMERGIIHRKSLFEDDEYRFGESLTQEVAYEGLLLRHRRLLHERIGAWLESRNGDAPVEGPSLIAHHYARSDNHEKAVEHLLRAATEAERLPAYHAAVDLYRQAWELADGVVRGRPDADARFRRWLMEATTGYLRVTVLYGSSVDPAAERAAERAREMAEAFGELDALATVYTLHGFLFTSDPQRFADGVRLVEQGLATARRVGSDLLVVQSSRAMASTYLLDGRLELAESTVNWAMSELERLGQATAHTDLYLGVRWMQNNVCYFRDQLARTVEGALALYEVSVAASNRTVQSVSATLLAQTYYVRGQYAEARQWAERGLRIGEAIDNHGTIHRAAALCLASAVELGERGERANLARYLDLAEQGLGMGGNLLMSIVPLVEGCIGLGELKRAERLARAAHERAAGRLREMLSSAALGQVALRRGPSHWVEAERWFDRTLELAEALGSRHMHAVANIGMGELAQQYSDRGGAAQYGAQALDSCRAIGLGHYEPRALRLGQEQDAAVALA